MSTRTTLLAAALAGAVAAGAAAPALADDNRYGYGYGYGYNDRYGGGGQFRSEIQQLDRQVTHAARSGVLSRSDAYALAREVDYLKRLYGQYARSGLDRREAYALNQRIERVRYSLNRAYSYRSNHRDQRWGDSRYDRNDRYYGRDYRRGHDRRGHDDDDDDD